MRARVVAVAVAAVVLTIGGISGVASAAPTAHATAPVAPTVTPTPMDPPADAVCPSDPTLLYYDDGCPDWDETAMAPADDLPEADGASAEQAQADDAGQPVTVSHAPLRYPACGPKPTPGVCIITDPAKLRSMGEYFDTPPTLVIIGGGK